jgi:hypothetical protein
MSGPPDDILITTFLGFCKMFILPPLLAVVITALACYFIMKLDKDS